MRSICVFAASNSTNSINQKLALHAASMLEDVKVDLLDLNDFEVPIFSLKREESGVPSLIDDFNTRLKAADGLIISFAEHNGSYSAAFKNIFDWNSRRKDENGWADKPALLLSTSPGGRGGASVLETAVGKFPHMGITVAGSFSLPSFHDNFKDGRLVDENLKAKLSHEVTNFSKAI